MVLMLHRIAPFEPKLAPNENMKISPEFLESFIIESKAQGYHFINLDELYDGLLSNNLKQNFLCFTIDDGYKDNLTYGAPIFTKHNVPFCIYVCTSFPESNHNMWWFALEDYLLKNDSMRFNGQEFRLTSQDSKEAMFLRLREHIISKVVDYTDCTQSMDELGIIYNPRDYDHLTLSWDEIIHLDRDIKLCTIGSHTHSHPIFKNLTNEQIAQDIRQSQELLKAHLGYAPVHFAYPFGSKIEVDSKHFKLIENLGFHTATTTRHGSIYSQHKHHLWALPRVFFGQNFMLESALRIRKKRVVTA